jgi:hypothetical protein
MPTTDRNSSSKRAKQSPSARVPNTESARESAKKTKEDQRDTRAAQDRERSDWEGMTPRPEQGEDDVAAPGQLPETD